MSKERNPDGSIRSERLQELYIAAMARKDVKQQVGCICANMIGQVSLYADMQPALANRQEVSLVRIMRTVGLTSDEITHLLKIAIKDLEDAHR